MNLLILPSHRILYHHGKLIFTLLPQSMQAEQYAYLDHDYGLDKNNNNSNNGGNGQGGQGKGYGPLLATLHYKTVNVYDWGNVVEYAGKKLGGGGEEGVGVKPWISHDFQKKVQVIDLYHTYNTFYGGNKHTHKKPQPTQPTLRAQCIISDKFGDLYKLPITAPPTPDLQPPIYTNSNLGIPKFLKHLSIPVQPPNPPNPPNPPSPPKEYYILADQQNRLKVYNAANPHEIISVWFMVNMNAIECGVVGGSVYLLQKFYDKVTLEHRVELHWFEGTRGNLEGDQYPGVRVGADLKLEHYGVQMKQCRYYTMLTTQTTLLTLHLFPTKILYQHYPTLPTASTPTAPLCGQLPIPEGKWDCLSALHINQPVKQGSNGAMFVIAYGCDVDAPGEVGKGIVDVGGGEVGVNVYERVVKLWVGY